MSDVHRKYEVRCPIHGFISFTDWEHGVMATAEFQRLRRIRQLAFTEFVYPGATHSRFEHSLGVMHLASRLYDSLVGRFDRQFREELDYDDTGLKRDRQLLRFAALLHDIGHGPLSHASEELMPIAANGKPYQHEQYSAAIIRTCLRDAIEKHPLNENCGLTADDIADLLEGRTTTRRAVFWRELLSGQLDADRMDYLLRDSYHAGVQYGRYDLDRVVATIMITRDPENERYRLGFEEGGLHAAESIVLARYFMFTQVYYHKTRVAFDIVLQRLLQELLPNGRFPAPNGAGLQRYLQWDDWKVMGAIANGKCGEWGQMIRGREQLRAVYSTSEVANQAEAEGLKQAVGKLGDLLVEESRAEKSWYKTGEADVPIVSRLAAGEERVLPLSAHSSVVKNMRQINQTRLYVRAAQREQALAALAESGGLHG